MNELQQYEKHESAIGENICGQFHQHITCSFCAEILRQKSTSLKSEYKKASCKKIRTKKAARKMLVKLTLSLYDIEIKFENQT